MDYEPAAHRVDVKFVGWSEERIATYVRRILASDPIAVYAARAHVRVVVAWPGCDLAICAAEVHDFLDGLAATMGVHMVSCREEPGKVSFVADVPFASALRYSDHANDDGSLAWRVLPQLRMRSIESIHFGVDSDAESAALQSLLCDDSERI